MFCPKCGAQQPDGAKFCGACGAPLEGGAPTVAAGNPSAAASQSKAPKKKVPVVPIAIVATAVVAVVAAGALVLPKILQSSFRGTVSIQQVDRDNGDARDFLTISVDEDKIVFNFESGGMYAGKSDNPSYKGAIESTETIGDSIVYTVSSLKNSEGDALNMLSSQGESTPIRYRIFVPKTFEKDGIAGTVGIYCENKLTGDSGEPSDGADGELNPIEASATLVTCDGGTAILNIGQGETDTEQAKQLDPSSGSYVQDFSELSDELGDSGQAISMKGTLSADGEGKYKVSLPDAVVDMLITVDQAS